MKLSRPTRNNLILLFVSIIAAIFLAEILLRIALPPPVSWTYPQENYLFDPEIGHWLEHNQLAFTHDKEVRTNSQGLRDKDYTQDVPGDVHRVLALGDSQTFGNGLQESDTWPKQLELLLNNKSGATSYEVMNGGLPASDTWQHEIIMRRMLGKYQLNGVILAFYVNDVVTRPGNIRFAQRSDRDAPSARIIYFVKKSVLLLSLRAAFDAVRQMLSPSRAFEIQNALLKGEDNPEISMRWNQVDLSLAEMKKMADDAGVWFLVVSLPRRDQVDGRMPADKYNHRLESIFDKYDIPYISMFQPLKKALEEHKNKLFIPWDGHNSQIANYVISSAILSRLAESELTGETSGK